LSPRENHAALAGVEPRAREFWNAVQADFRPGPHKLWPAADTLAHAANRAQDLRREFAVGGQV